MKGRENAHSSSSQLCCGVMAGLLADGFVAVPIDHSKLLNPKDAGEKPPRSLTSEAFKLPESQVASTTVQYAKEHLSQETFNHSMRVYCYGPPCPS